MPATLASRHMYIPPSAGSTSNITRLPFSSNTWMSDYCHAEHPVFVLDTTDLFSSSGQHGVPSEPVDHRDRVSGAEAIQGGID